MKTVAIEPMFHTSHAAGDGYLKKRVMRGWAILGYGMSSVDWVGEQTSNVADAFSKLKYLVVLQFAQQTFVVSIKSIEASTEREALIIAAKRAIVALKEASIPLGNLMDWAVHEDTPERRRFLKIGSQAYRKTIADKTNRQWRNAA